MDQLCREKRVPRDIFIGSYLDFLVNGAEGICEAPLEEISAMLMNPRHEYEEKRRNAPAADEDFVNVNDTSEFMTIKAVPQENPYSRRHMYRRAVSFFDEEQEELWSRLGSENRTPEKK